MFEFLTDHHAEARAFYGPAFDAVYEFERRREECRRMARDLVPTLVDEFAYQAPGLDDVWPTTEALMR